MRSPSRRLHVGPGTTRQPAANSSKERADRHCAYNNILPRRYKSGRGPRGVPWSRRSAFAPSLSGPTRIRAEAPERLGLTQVRSSDYLRPAALDHMASAWALSAMRLPRAKLTSAG